MNPPVLPRDKSNRITIYIGLCGEFMGRDLLLNKALYEDLKKKFEKWTTPDQQRVWRVESTGCCVVEDNLRLIDLHQATHGGCDTLVLKGTLRHSRTGRLHLEAKEMSREAYRKEMEREERKRIKTCQMAKR